VYDCIDLYNNTKNSLNAISKDLIIRNLGWHLERLYVSAWKQKRDLAKEEISFLNEMFRKHIENNRIKKTYLMLIALYLPFSCGYFLMNKVIPSFINKYGK
jgi:hypothetical protein